MDIDPQVQRAYSAIQAHFIEHGRAPHYTELAGLLGVDVEVARGLQREAVDHGVGAWCIAGTDYIESFAPFYNVPNRTKVSVDREQKWFAQCGLEALSMRFIFPGHEVRIEEACLDCGDAVVVVMRDDEILEVTPEDAVGHFNPPFNPQRRAGLSGSFV
jgi:hypothetical protein